jgi:hypothetical protein
MLAIILWMALAASGGVLSGILIDKYVAPATPPIILPQTQTSGNFDFLKTAKLIGILTIGAVAVHLVLKLFKIKIFNKVIR